MSNHLTTAEAAARIGLSEEAVRILCRSGQLSGVVQDRQRGPWRIPNNAFYAWMAENSAAQAVPPPPNPPDPDSTPNPNQNSKHWSERRQKRSWWQLVLIIGAIVALLVGIFDFGQKTQPIIATATPLPFASESDNETLIVIATFSRTEGLVDTDAHHEIRRGIQQKADEFDFSNLRVEVEPTPYRAEAREEAEKLGKRYQASMVIWGADSGVRVTVNYLNLKEPDFEAADVKIPETEPSDLAKPDAYAKFITQDLPSQLTFLSLFAVGESYYLEKNYEQAIRLIELALDSLPKDENSLEGLVAPYFRLGWLYQVAVENHKLAIANYDQALKHDPNNAEAYYNRGKARSDLGDLEGARADYGKALKLNPDNVEAYNKREKARSDLAELEEAIGDYNQALKLNPDYAEAYNSRGNARYDLGELKGAIAD